MSRPVYRPPGTFYLLSRRVDRREFRLRPGQEFEQVVGILITKAAKATGILVVHLVVMSNHLHAVLWDPRGHVTDFLKEALSGIARVANDAHGRSGHFWQQDDGKTLKALKDLGAVIDAVAYSYLNPTEARLVAHPSVWPGVNTDPADIGTNKCVVFERPKGFFLEDGTVPMREELTVGVPDFVDAADFREQVAVSVNRQVKEIQTEVRRKGGRFLGHDAILATDIFAAPTSSEPVNAGRTAKPVERVAARDPEIKKRAAVQLAEFEREYARCRRRVADGERDVLFPAGTYHLWRHCGFQREADPPPEQAFQAA